MAAVQATELLTQELNGEQGRIDRKKEKSTMMKKIHAKKDRDLLMMQERVDTADDRENALKEKLRDTIVESNIKGVLLVDIRTSIQDMKAEYAQQLSQV